MAHKCLKTSCPKEKRTRMAFLNKLWAETEDKMYLLKFKLSVITFYAICSQ